MGIRNHGTKLILQVPDLHLSYGDLIIMQTDTDTSPQLQGDVKA